MSWLRMGIWNRVLDFLVLEEKIPFVVFKDIFFGTRGIGFWSSIMLIYLFFFFYTFVEI